MFEKEAEERAKIFANINYNEPDNYGDTKEIGLSAYEAGFNAGAEFGYNKANEWHKLRKNPDDLPEEDVYVFLLCEDDAYPVVARRHTFRTWGRTEWEWDCRWGSGYQIKQGDPKVISWKEIVLPELPKESE